MKEVTFEDHVPENKIGVGVNTLAQRTGDVKKEHWKLSLWNAASSAEGGSRLSMVEIAQIANC